MAARALTQTDPTRRRSFLSGEQVQTKDRKSGGFVFTQVQLPTRPSSDREVKHQFAAKEATYNGRFREAADLWRATITEDGVIGGLVDGIAYGLFGLPLSFTGDPGMVAALADANGTPGEYGLMMPNNEAASIFKDGIGLGLGIGQQIKPKDFLVTPVGDHYLPRLRWWNPRWIRQDVMSRRWFLMTRTNEIEIEFGDGEWLGYMPYPETDVWLHGPWIWATLEFVFARDARFDMARHSEVLAPVRVARGNKPTTKQARIDMAKKIDRMARMNGLVLPYEWIYEVVEAKGSDGIAAIYNGIIQRARETASIGFCGNVVMIEGPSGFTNADIFRRVTDSKRLFYATTWMRFVYEQVLPWWGIDNYGSTNVPWPRYKVESPEDTIAKYKAMAEATKTIASISDDLKKVGLRPRQQWAIEVCQDAGIVAEQIPAEGGIVPRLEFAPTDLAGFVTVNEARGSQGLGPINEGGDEMISVYLQGGSKDSVGTVRAPALRVPGVDVSRLSESGEIRKLARRRGWQSKGIFRIAA